MPRFVIEREMPGAGSLSPEELRAASQKSLDVTAETLRPRSIGSRRRSRATRCSACGTPPTRMRSMSTPAGPASQ